MEKKRNRSCSSVEAVLNGAGLKVKFIAPLRNKHDRTNYTAQAEKLPK